MRILAAAFFLAVVGPAAAQHQHATPYAGMQQRAVKALNEQQVSDLREGRGMGLALAGELNGYPGPSHALELADQLRLSIAQRESLKTLLQSMKAEAVSVGETLLARESDLDRAFAEKRISQDSLISLTAGIAESQGKLRAVHLRYHLLTAELLSDDQRKLYAGLRGYR